MRYADEDRVYLQSLHATMACALVEGTSLYDVEVELVGRGIAASCTCPYAEDGTWWQSPAPHHRQPRRPDARG